MFRSVAYTGVVALFLISVCATVLSLLGMIFSGLATVYELVVNNSRDGAPWKDVTTVFFIGFIVCGVAMIISGIVADELD